MHLLLFVYEGDSNNNNTTDVKLIDFAHWYKSKPEDGRKDNGSIKGINNILKVLNAIESTSIAVSDYQSIELKQFDIKISFIVIFILITVIYLYRTSIYRTSTLYRYL